MVCMRAQIVIFCIAKQKIPGLVVLLVMGIGVCSSATYEVFIRHPGNGHYIPSTIGPLNFRFYVILSAILERRCEILILPRRPEAITGNLSRQQHRRHPVSSQGVISSIIVSFEI